MITIENSRRYKRFKADYLLKCHSASEPENEYIYNVTDISASGLRFWSDKFFGEGSLIQLSFVMPPLNRSFEILARAVRVKRYQDRDPQSPPIYYIAVGFLDISAKDQIQINDFIERIAQDKNARKFINSQMKVKRQPEEQFNS